MKRIYLITTISAVLVGCGGLESELADDESEIRFGTETNVRSGVGAVFDVALGTICSGTLITPHVVLTAGHCVFGHDVANMRFSVETEPVFDELTLISAGVVHPELNIASPAHGRDLALLKLRARSTQDPFELDEDGTTLMQTLAIAGYGRDETEAGVGFKRTGEMVLEARFDTDDGAVANAILALTPPGEFEPGTPPDDRFQITCPGDSGGPAFDNTSGVARVAGVASFISATDVNNPCTTAQNAFHTAVAPFAPWIAATRDALAPPGSCAGDDDAAFETRSGGCRQISNGRVYSRRAPTNRTRNQAINYCNNLVEGGRSDWVLPTRPMLRNAASAGAATHFVSTTGRPWTSTAGSAGNGFTVNLVTAVATETPLSALRPVFCTRIGD